jgi:ribonuclease E
VEPSLQAAFVEYGGNKQGFLPFAEIHYDYFQIPTSDKEKFKELESKEAAEAEAEAENAPQPLVAENEPFATAEEVTPAEDKSAVSQEVAIENAFAAVVPETGENREYAEPMEVEPEVDVVGQDEDAPTIKRSSLYRKYKIQDVIKRNQIILIQVVK